MNTIDIERRTHMLFGARDEPVYSKLNLALQESIAFTLIQEIEYSQKSKYITVDFSTLSAFIKTIEDYTKENKD